jgi:cathepsin B
MYLLADKHGVYTLTVNASYGGGHAIEIIGWGTDTINGTTVDYWSCQNTYGEQWGEKGYFRIRRGTNEIGIEQEVVAGMPVLR